MSAKAKYFAGSGIIFCLVVVLTPLNELSVTFPLAMLSAALSGLGFREMLPKNKD